MPLMTSIDASVARRSVSRVNRRRAAMPGAGASSTSSVTVPPARSINVVQTRVGAFMAVSVCASTPQAARQAATRRPVSPPLKPAVCAGVPSATSARAVLSALPAADSTTCRARLTSSVSNRSNTSVRCKTGVNPKHSTFFIKIHSPPTCVR
ncbi:MAG TPA: hypothetical protein PLW27_03590 [Kiritimatiellia bacterium]|nr:hypothetical protein [Kiritimatiellia bacterium]